MKKNTKKKLFAFDAAHIQKSQGLIAGVDEVGRGPLAGPVVAAAVIFFPGTRPIPVNDSKQLTATTRLCLFRQILRSALIGVGYVEETTIDEINIYQASRLAMLKAVLSLTRTPDCLLIDGPIRLDLPIPQRPIIRGDTLSASIAAASIIAKVYRDAWMERLHQIYPQYDFKENKGYATRAHLRCIRDLGPCPIHRRSFAPVRLAEAGAFVPEMLYEAEPK